MIGAKHMPQHPCIGCVYFKECGETNRTMPCYGRKTKSELKAELKAEKERIFRERRAKND